VHTQSPSLPERRARVLLLEDDPAIARTVVYTLEREGFTVEHVQLVRNAWICLDSLQAPDLAVLDVGLPDGSGLDLCRELRQRGSIIPLILLTARSDETDRVLGLELGADDYIAKPFSPRELAARVRALLRRSRMQAAQAPRASLFSVDEGGGRISLDGQWLSLTRRELGLLQCLLDSPGRIHSRDALLDAVWGQSADSNDRTVDTHVKTLRAKLREIRPDLDSIVTHRGLGYSLELPDE
jgi:two-component system catabolic regulation response regulator CreB